MWNGSRSGIATVFCPFAMFTISGKRLVRGNMAGSSLGMRGRLGFVLASGLLAGTIRNSSHIVLGILYHHLPY